MSLIVLATASYSVSYTLLAFTFASAAASFSKSDAPFKSVSVSQTFSTVSQRVRQCLSVEITESVARCCNLHLCLTLVHRVDKSLGVHITHYHGKKLLALMSSSVLASASSSASAFNSPCMLLSVSAFILCKHFCQRHNTDQWLALLLCKAVVQRVKQCLNFHITHCLVKTNQRQSLSTCRKAHSTAL